MKCDICSLDIGGWSGCNGHKKPNIAVLHELRNEIKLYVENIKRYRVFYAEPAKWSLWFPVDLKFRLKDYKYTASEELWENLVLKKNERWLYISILQLEDEQGYVWDRTIQDKKEWHKIVKNVG